MYDQSFIPSPIRFALFKSEGYCGKVFLTVPGRLPKSKAWTDSLLKEIRTTIRKGKILINLPDLSTDSFSPDAAKPFCHAPFELQREVVRLHSPHAHLVTVTNIKGDQAIDPTIFKLDSKLSDSALTSYFDDLCDANHQLSGRRAATIFCFIPEINSFAAVAANSALKRMTSRFFELHASPSVYAVTYVSDPHSNQEGFELIISNPALTDLTPIMTSALVTTLK